MGFIWLKMSLNKVVMASDMLSKAYVLLLVIFAPGLVSEWLWTSVIAERTSLVLFNIFIAVKQPMF